MYHSLPYIYIGYHAGLIQGVDGLATHPPWVLQPHNFQLEWFLHLISGGQIFKIFVGSTIDGKRFAGLNIHGFSAVKVFTEILSRCLDHKFSIFSTIKERRLYSRENLCGTPENCEQCKSLAQWIFPCLQYAPRPPCKIACAWVCFACYTHLLLW